MEYKDQKNQKTEGPPIEDLDEMLEKLKSGSIGINQDPPEDAPEEAGTETRMAKRVNHSPEPDSEDSQKEKEPFNLKKELISWVQVFVTAALIALFINHFIIANSQVPTGSMETTIMPGDRVIGSRLSYRFGEPERGDIAIFIYPDDEALGIKTYYVKRIIGMPGDTIDIVDGQVYLNGSDIPVSEPYLREPMEPEPPQHFEVPEDCYFMMGDNRNHSNDSRRWKNHFVKREKLVAKVLIQYFPKIRILH